MPKKKKPEIPKSFETVLELFHSTPIYFKDLTNAKELNQHLLRKTIQKFLLKWMKLFL